MNSTRIAVAGLGEAGYELHLPALDGIEGATVVGLADPSEEMRDRAGAGRDAPVFAEVSAMLEATDPDVLIVATPPHTHLALTELALTNGVHAVVEKPFARSLDEADRLIELSRQTGRQIALNHEFREMPILASVKEAVHSGSHGRLVFAQLWQLMNMPSSGEAGWRGALAHRTLFEAGVHLVDYAMALFDGKPLAVTAQLSNGGQPDAAGDSIVVLTLEFGDGRLATITQTRLSRGSRQYFEVRADTTEASFRGSFGGRARVTAGLYRSTTPRIRMEFGVSGMSWIERGDDRSFLARNPKLPRVHATRRILVDAIEAFGAGSPPLVDAQWGRDVLEVVVASYVSAREGRRVDLASGQTESLTGVELGPADEI